MKISKIIQKTKRKAWIKNISRTYLGIAVMLGAVWDLCEAGLGMWLRSCAYLLSGAMMTGAALFL